MELNSKQEHILNIAMQLFAEKGYSATSVREIANKANVNLSMISYYFGGKEGLLNAIVASKSDQLKIRMEKMQKEDWISAEEKIAVLVEELVDRFWANRVMYRVINHEQNFKGNEDLKAAVVALRKVRYDQFKNVIQSGQKRGFFKKEVNIPLLHASMIGTLKHVNFADDFYFDELGIENDVEGDFRMLEEVKTHISNLFKLMLTTNEK